MHNFHKVREMRRGVNSMQRLVHKGDEIYGSHANTTSNRPIWHDSVRRSIIKPFKDNPIS
jgi:hypothetical protein